MSDTSYPFETVGGTNSEVGEIGESIVPSLTIQGIMVEGLRRVPQQALALWDGALRRVVIIDPEDAGMAGILSALGVPALLADYEPDEPGKATSTYQTVGTSLPGLAALLDPVAPKFSAQRLVSKVLDITQTYWIEWDQVDARLRVRIPSSSEASAIHSAISSAPPLAIFAVNS